MDVDIDFDITDCTGKNIKFSSYNMLVDFLESESCFWINKKDEVSSARAANSRYIDFGSKLRSALATIQGWGEVQDLADNDIKSKLNTLKAGVLKSANINWIWSGHGYSVKYAEYLREYGPTRADAFIDFVSSKTFSNITSAEVFQGYLFGYEYLYHESDIISRREVERESLNRLKDEFIDKKEELYVEKESIIKDFSDWSDKTTEKFNRTYTAQRRLFGIHSKKQDASFNEKINEWQNNISMLENTYQEKLKLKKPAEYWSSASKRYGIESLFGIVAFISINIFALMYFKEFFFAWLKDEPVALGLSSLQGAVIFGSLAAIYAYMIRMLAKLTFSSLHLMRDTKEREHLTYLYLSLSHEAEVDDKSREIVLQALFSRSDSGLLGQDSGVTMPGVGGFLDHLNKK